MLNVEISGNTLSSGNYHSSLSEKCAKQQSGVCDVYFYYYFSLTEKKRKRQKLPATIWDFPHFGKANYPEGIGYEVSVTATGVDFFFFNGISAATNV